MFVKKDTLVRISVSLYDMQGNLLEQTPEEGYTYLHGHSDIFPGLENALTGKPVGAEVSVTLDPVDAFGDFDDRAIYLVDVDQLGDPQDIRVGLVFESILGVVSDGRHYRVTEIAEGKALLDANHPYAGWTLRFELKVLGIEQADPETIGGGDVVLPSFLGLADKLIAETDD